MSDSVEVEGIVITTHGGLISDLHKDAVADMWASLTGKSFLLELVSNTKDVNKVTTYARHDPNFDASKELRAFRCTFDVPSDFGDIGAVLVKNEHHTKIFFVSIVLGNRGTFTCNSWVHSKHENGEPRIFFTNKSYLPSKTPEGLKELRARDLKCLRGDGKGERKSFDRIYDYDVYNDLGDRPVLGGKQHPYPRRCRTGREEPKKSTELVPPTTTELDLPITTQLGPSIKTKTGHEPRVTSEGKEYFYVPIDEDFSETKMDESALRILINLLHSEISTLDSVVTDKEEGFPLFRDINSLYNEGVHGPTPHNNILKRFIEKILDGADTIIQFSSPEIINRDTFSWSNDEEFCRQMLAGVNPCSIQLVTEWPLKSKLDPNVYGPAESKITKDHVEKKIRGFMTFDEAYAQKKLFMLDYHDLLLPYVNKTREIKGTTLYGSRTLLFLTPDGTLMPIAIELTRPQSDNKPQWKHVYQPTAHATDAWLWKLAKAHVLAHDSGYHQLVSHWLRTHCVSEPYIISTHRKLGQVHPIYRLLFPHFRFTMQINALARKNLINADGVIESTFSTARYSMELSSDAYKLWRFDHEALPADLISRGMAIEDKNEPHGVKLTIEDYPYANDGLLLWDAIEQWVTSYVNHYYPQEHPVEDDEELQAWWTEIRRVGHGDKKDEPGWPELKTQNDLIKIVSTIIWVVSGHHAAVNFGQYDFAGYFPNRPTIARTNMPNEDHMVDNIYTAEWKSFLERPEAALLQCLPSQLQAMKVISLLNVLSDHSPDEIYIGEKIEPAWDVEPAIKKAFKTFSDALEEMGDTIDKRNKDPKWKNRSGAGIVPYQLLNPYSKNSDTKGDTKGVTRGVTKDDTKGDTKGVKRGVPNSVSI